MQFYVSNKLAHRSLLQIEDLLGARENRFGEKKIEIAKICHGHSRSRCHFRKLTRQE